MVCQEPVGVEPTATARCEDGMFSYAAHHPRAGSRHCGVAELYS